MAQLLFLQVFWGDHWHHYHRPKARSAAQGKKVLSKQPGRAQTLTANQRLRFNPEIPRPFPDRQHHGSQETLVRANTHNVRVHPKPAARGFSLHMEEPRTSPKDQLCERACDPPSAQLTESMMEKSLADRGHSTFSERAPAPEKDGLCSHPSPVASS